MMALPWEEAALTRSHDRTAFDCGDGDLNAYLRRYARQNHASGGAKCFVAVPRETPARILGFYTVSPASIEFSRAPAVVTRGLGRYEVPVYRLGRLAVDRTVQARGLGGALLWRALARCMSVARQAGGVALLIDAKSDRAAAWYEGFGAVRLLDAPRSLVLPFAMAAKVMAREERRVRGTAGTIARSGAVQRTLVIAARVCARTCAFSPVAAGRSLPSPIVPMRDRAMPLAMRRCGATAPAHVAATRAISDYQVPASIIPGQPLQRGSHPRPRHGAAVPAPALAERQSGGAL
jgi:GNAT superfamily N-acetyltransferase